MQEFQANFRSSWLLLKSKLSTSLSAFFGLRMTRAKFQSLLERLLSLLELLLLFK
jgi:hypothetical protein